MDLNLIKEFLVKINLTSVLLVLMFIAASVLTLKFDQNISSLPGIISICSFIMACLITMITIVGIISKEMYEPIIKNYQNQISDLKSNHRHVEKSYQETLSNKQNNKLESNLKIRNPSSTESS